MREDDAATTRSLPRRMLRLAFIVVVFLTVGSLASGMAFGIFFSLVGLSPTAPAADVLNEIARLVSRITLAVFLAAWKQALGAGLVFGIADLFGRAGWLLAALVGAIAGVLIFRLDQLSRPDPLIAIVALCGVVGALGSYWLIRRASEAAS